MGLGQDERLPFRDFREVGDVIKVQTNLGWEAVAVRPDLKGVAECGAVSQGHQTPPRKGLL